MRTNKWFYLLPDKHSSLVVRSFLVHVVQHGWFYFIAPPLGIDTTDINQPLLDKFQDVCLEQSRVLLTMSVWEGRIRMLNKLRFKGITAPNIPTLDLNYPFVAIMQYSGQLR